MEEAELMAAAQALARWFRSQGISVRDGVLVMLYTTAMAAAASGVDDPTKVIRAAIKEVARVMRR